MAGMKKDGSSIEKLIQQSKFKDSFEKSLINIFYTANYFRDIHLEVFTAYKIQSQHFNILRILKGQHPQPISPGYIKDVMLDKGRDITRLIDKLENMGWVSRDNCNINRRKVNIKLTKLGLRQVNEINKKLAKTHDKIKKLTDNEYDLLSSLLDKMR